MPHLILEYTANIVEKENFNALFEQCHQILATMLPTNIASCKSRASECPVFFIGDGAPGQGFVHVKLQVLSGRSEELLQKIAEKLLLLLKEYFVKSSQALSLQFSVEISNLATYAKA